MMGARTCSSIIKVTRFLIAKTYKMTSYRVIDMGIIKTFIKKDSSNKNTVDTFIIILPFLEKL